MMDIQGTKEYHYVYHEDVFHREVDKHPSDNTAELQALVLDLWRNPNYNGYITAKGIQRRRELLSLDTLSKL